MPQPPKPDDLKSLLPVQAETVLSTQAPDDDCHLPPAEQAAATSMKPKRRSEFIHGRACARAALAALGFPDESIPVGDSREPVWPKGVVGSISHCEMVAAATAGRCDEIGGLGIDLELAEPLDAATLNLICRAPEQSWLQHTDDKLQFAKLIFSAKESIFKCIWPTIRHFVDFQDIGIQIDINANTFAPVEWADSLPAPLIASISGRYLLRNGWIMTTASLPRQETGSGSDSHEP